MSVCPPNTHEFSAVPARYRSTGSGQQPRRITPDGRSRRSRDGWEGGWKASAIHAPLVRKGHFDRDEWELYHVDVDRAEAVNLAKEHPDKLKALIKAWFEEADKNFVLPLDDRTPAEILGVERPSEEAPRERYIYYPGTSPVPEVSRSTCAAVHTRFSRMSRSAATARA